MTIDLNRRFIEWRREDGLDPDTYARFLGSDGILGWPDLLQKRRAVVLAEAGGGKTEELKESARRAIAEGRFAAYATVEDVGRDGLREAMRPVDRLRLDAWLLSNQPGWLFIDSVDEAKLSGVRLQTALRKTAVGIAGAESRAHVILSGRYTDWEFAADLHRLNEELPIPRDQIALSPPRSEELLIQTIRRERPPENKTVPEAPFVAIMLNLDEERVRAFAAAKGVPRLDEFISGIDAANLWRFARRPLDLAWLAQFWRTKGRFGFFSEMLETCLEERAEEPNLDRAGQDTLDATRVLRALERVGAALVFARASTIIVPDGQIAAAADRDNAPIDIADILPDWSPEDRRRLLTRPVFDPATFGRARLHNDNEGVVRAYLTARWLLGLRTENLSQAALFDLIFADIYGVKLIKPSMREVAAWLATRDQAIAREIISREPFLLLAAGDPASLPTDVRRGVLWSVTELLAARDREISIIGHETAKRFARPDIAETVRQIWDDRQANRQIRELMLRLIWLGGLTECAGLTVDAAFGSYDDRYTRVYAGRALIATGGDDAKHRYCAWLEVNCTRVPLVIVWDAIDGLFPTHLNIDILLDVLSRIDVTDRDSAMGLEWQGADWVDRLKSRADLEKLLSGLLQQVGGDTGSLGLEDNSREDAYFPAIAAAAFHILQRCPDDEAPLLTIDAALRLGDHRHRGRRRREVGLPIAQELRKTSMRRRAAMWRAAERMTGNRMLQGHPIEHPWQMEILGWPPELTIGDIDWLLQDAPLRKMETERCLAINAALDVWKQADSDAIVLSRIEAVAKANPVLTKAYHAWMQPRQPSQQEIESTRDIEAIQQRNAIQQAKQDQSWIDFIGGLRADTNQLQRLRPPSKNGIDSRLFHLWQLLNSATGNNRYAIDSVAAVEPILGAKLAAALRDALIDLWRRWRPTRKSERASSEKNQIGTVDCIGITGVSLESKTNPRWADRLGSDDARLATIYATLELGRFPDWLTELADSKPLEVAQTLMEEVGTELNDTDAGPHGLVVQALEWADAKLARLVGPQLVAELEHHSKLPPVVLSPTLETIVRGGGGDRDRFIALSVDRFARTDDLEVCSLYISAVFALDPRIGTDALFSRLDQLNSGSQAELVQRVLPNIFGDNFARPGIDLAKLPFNCLERIVRLAYSAVRVEEDNKRPPGNPYSPDGRDRAEGARSAAFSQLVRTPGRATFDAVLRLAKTTGFPVPATRLEALANDRAAEDAESAPWPPGECFAFERSFETAPRTSRDLQLVAIRRIADIQHDLVHSDFAQGSVVQALPDEKAVQNWIADRMRSVQGRSYSVEREVHVVDEKEPDIRLRATSSDAAVPIEIKVAGESWTVKDLEAALKDQLCGQYLRARDGRHGILLLVHQSRRAKGWKGARRALLSFDALVAHLGTLATKISESVRKHF